jgi:glutathione S-transferase
MTTPVLCYSPMTCAVSEIVACEWAGVPYRLCRLTHEERQSQAFRSAVNENGQVPAMVLTDGRILTENAALLPWIADQRPERRLAPACGTPERYELYRSLAWFDSTFHASHVPFFVPARYSADPAHHDAVKQQSTVRTEEALGRLERQLTGHEHVLFDRRTVLDAYVFAMARWTEERLDHAKRFPNVKAFADRLRTDAGVQRMLAIERGELTAPAGNDDTFRGHVPLTELLSSLSARRTA